MFFVVVVVAGSVLVIVIGGGAVGDAVVVAGACGGCGTGQRRGGWLRLRGQRSVGEAMWSRPLTRPPTTTGGCSSRNRFVLLRRI